MKKMKINEALLILSRIIGLLSFYICLIIIIILKAFFNYFQNISWWLIFSPVLLSLGIAIFLFLFYIILLIFEKRR